MTNSSKFNIHKVAEDNSMKILSNNPCPKGGLNMLIRNTLEN